jgi:hypothetical protein
MDLMSESIISRAVGLDDKSEDPSDTSILDDERPRILGVKKSDTL